MKPLLLFLALIATLRASPPTDFIRIDQDDTHARLQTSITSYQKDDKIVTLIGAIHIGDAEYYQTLNQEFTNYDALLFELIGGENIAKTLNGKPRPAQEPDGRPANGGRIRSSHRGKGRRPSLLCPRNKRQYL